jgi:SWI/SNF-related matrix-associated actin-dependent regulator of chromatin subfamily A-like protein 1
MKAYRLTGMSKINGCCDFIETLVENGAKFLVFAHHQDVLDGIENCLLKKKVGCMRICGKTPMEKRHQRVKDFQTNPNTRVGVLSITAASQGLTLTAASTVIFAELTWTPSIMA